MVIQVIQANRRPSRSERIGQALSGALQSGLEAYQQHQKKEGYNRALKNIEGIYGNPDMNDQQKLVQVYRQLADNPELAKQLGSQLSQYGQRQLSPLEEAQRQRILLENKSLQGEEDFLTQLMGGGQNARTQPGMTDNLRPDRRSRDGFETTPDSQLDEKGQATTFDYNDPSTWSDKEIQKFRSFEGKSPKARTFAKMAQNEYERRQESKKAKSKYQENVAPLETALETLGRMEKIGKKGNLGIGTSVRGVLSPNARREAAEYERLGKSLISFASNIPIRNRQEFEVLAHDLYDPSISDASREGILQAMKRIIQSSMAQYQQPEDEGVKNQAEPRALRQKEKPPLSSFMR